MTQPPYSNVQDEQSGTTSLTHSLNLNKELRSENTNLNVNVNESNGYSEPSSSGGDHYSEIDKSAAPSPSPNPTSWPEDLHGEDDEQATTYANVVSRNLPNVPAPPPPPVGPNESPTKPSVSKSNNIDIAQSMNEMSLEAKTQQMSPKKLDPTFLAELEKHLGEKEASKNTNAAQQPQQPPVQHVHPMQQMPPPAAQTSVAPSNVSHAGPPLSNVAMAAVAAVSKPPDNTVIPMLRPPPQSIKPKSPNCDQLQRGNATSSSFNFPNKVQNQWPTKSTNIQRPRSQIGYPTQMSAECSSTDAVVAQMWHQNQQQQQQQHQNYSGNSSNLLQSVSNHHHAPSNLESAAQNVAAAYHQQFPHLPPPGPTNTQPPTPVHSASAASTLQRPASIAGTILSEQVYAELRQTVPNLDQLSQSEFNTLYNKTVRQNILRSYQANSNALASATSNMVSKIMKTYI